MIDIAHITSNMILALHQYDNVGTPRTITSSGIMFLSQHILLCLGMDQKSDIFSETLGGEYIYGIYI